MGKRVSKPTVIKMMEGAYEKTPNREPKNEPKPKPEIPKAEKYLDKKAKKIYRNLAPRLERLGLLTEVDGPSFNAMCQLLARISEVSEQINNTGGPLVDGKKGREPHPAAAAERQYFALLRQYFSEFGLSPRGRAGITVSGADVVDDMDELLD